MNGAESLVRTLVNGGVNVCFANPGTTEIHLVDALDRVPAMRCVPCLFEGVCTGAADGYARMSGAPAATLLHLGPGLSNGLANLHNAGRARVPLLNIVGDHASFHRKYDAPLTSDIEAIARPFSAWLRSSDSAEHLGRDGAEAIAASRTAPGRIATLIVPADAAWSDGGRAADAHQIPCPKLPPDSTIERAAELLRNGHPTAILLAGRSAQGVCLVRAGRIAAATGARLMVPFAFPRLERGAGRPPVERIAYVTQQAIDQLRGIRQLILVDAPAPVAFFGHPDRRSVLTPENCTTLALVSPGEDTQGALAALAVAVSAGAQLQAEPLKRLEPPSGDITLAGLAQAVGATLPQDAIVIDESLTSGRGMMAATRGAPPHDWLVNTGGSIGIGMPLAVGAAIACPGRAVLCLQGDGSAMYTLQALWTAARERLPITTVIFANRSYNILKGELAAIAASPGPRALETLDLGRPDLDFVSLAKGMGVAALRATTLEGFSSALMSGFESGAPNLIEVPL
jgi:acetolactate synthase-1/2/3 large subunit